MASISSSKDINPPSILFEQDPTRPNEWRATNRARSHGPLAVVPGLVLHLGQAQRLQHRWHVVAESAPESLLQAVPAADRVLANEPTPRHCLPGPASAHRRCQRHPIAVLLEH